MLNYYVNFDTTYRLTRLTKTKTAITCSDWKAEKRNCCASISGV